MSRSSVQEMLRRRAAWGVEVIHPKMRKEPGVRQWRVLASPSGGPAPEQVEHRGHLLLVTTPEKKLIRGVERKPRARKKSVKGSGKGTGAPQPKRISGWKGEKGEEGEKEREREVCGTR